MTSMEFSMEFWGVEVKPGEKVKCEPGEGRLLHLSQAALGETKDKGAERVQIFVKVDDKKLVLGTLSAENCAQISYDVVFEKEFELSHSSKSTSVYFCGYNSVLHDNESGSDDEDVDSEEDVQIFQNANGKPKVKEQEVKRTADAGKKNLVAKQKAKAVEQTKKDEPKADDEDEDDDDEDEDDDDSEDESKDDEDMVDVMSDSDDEDEESDEEEETPPKKAAIGKKRTPDSASKTPVPAKKAKLVTPSTGQKTGGDGKKGGHVATPHPAKKGVTAPANSDKSKHQTPKSVGSVTCESCSRHFNSEGALQSHTKAKHGELILS